MRQLVKEMSISHADFLRLLPLAMGGMPYSYANLRIQAAQGMRRVMIELSEQRLIQIGALSLPSIIMTLKSVGFGDQEWTAFLRRFDATFHRGGG
ncbi:MAG: hypothetical protein A3H91_01065 [Gammaproteobacteria bacterium RIFCSPLOWO2_02_FULL_61_13]|nr:MAG: hypothetical protein A3H91_01065 [Gammaproteobacteria bacterium RIFCSPLOWO2_02_FULL_61_13]